MELLNYYKDRIDDLLVIHDDLDYLPVSCGLNKAEAPAAIMESKISSPI